MLASVFRIAQIYGKEGPRPLYTSDAADDLTRVDLGGRRIIISYTHLTLPTSLLCIFLLFRLLLQHSHMSPVQSSHFSIISSIATLN